MEERTIVDILFELKDLEMACEFENFVVELLLNDDPGDPKLFLNISSKQEIEAGVPARTLAVKHYENIAIIDRCVAKYINSVTPKFNKLIEELKKMAKDKCHPKKQP